MNTVDHEPRLGSTDGRARIRFELEDTDLGEAEVLWGEWVSPDALRADNIPLLVFGVSLGDVVTVELGSEPYPVTGVVARGGHSTYRIMLDPGAPTAEDRLREIVTQGCGYERLTPRFLAIDVPPETDIFRVYDLLAKGLSDGIWTFEEAHCGHPVS